MTIAVVMDVSGSMDHFVRLFQLDGALKEIQLESVGGSNVEKLRQLIEEYDHVYFFTDTFMANDILVWMKILDSKLTVINVQKESS